MPSWQLASEGAFKRKSGGGSAAIIDGKHVRAERDRLVPIVGGERGEGGRSFGGEPNHFSARLHHFKALNGACADQWIEMVCHQPGCA